MWLRGSVIQKKAGRVFYAKLAADLFSASLLLVESYSKETGWFTGYGIRKAFKFAFRKTTLSLGNGLNGQIYCLRPNRLFRKNGHFRKTHHP